MDIKEFINSTVKQLEDESFKLLKEKLIGEYIQFSFIDDDAISCEVVCEKLADYFEKIEIKTGDEFAKILAKYVSNIDEVVRRYIPKEPSAKKGEPTPPMPRSLKYYKYATEIKLSRDLTMKQVADYSRIMMSLYMVAINNGMKEVDKYEFSTEGLDLDKIVSAMKEEKPGLGLPIGKPTLGLPIGKPGIGLTLGKKVMFNLEDRYSTDTATFAILMIMLFYVKNNEVEGE